MERLVRDSLGRVLRGSGSPRRVVSLVPSHTETLFALGAGDAIVGVTDFCVHPAAALASVARVGGTKTPDLERVRALAPDWVIANREENRRIDVERMERAGLTVFVTDARSVVQAREEVVQLGALVGRELQALQLAEQIDAALRPLPPESRRTRVVALIWKDPYMAVGGDCFAHDLLRCSGGENPFAAERRRYPQLSAERIAAADPEVILLPTEPYDFGPRERTELLGWPCAAARDGRVHVVEGELLTWYGPRIPRALSTFAALLAVAR